MADTAYSISTVRGKTVRITKLDSCGNPVSGAGGQFVTTGFITVKNTPNFDEGNDVKLSNANDQIVVFEKGAVTLLNHGLEIEFVQADTGGIPMMTGDTGIVDAATLTAGWIESMLQARNAFFAMEVWTGVADQQCVGTGKKYGYWLYPFIENGRVTAGDITNKETDFTVAANTRFGNNWGKGPYDVVSSSSPAVTPAWLPSLLPASASRLFMVTTVAPPVASAVGPQTLTPVSS